VNKRREDAKAKMRASAKLNVRALVTGGAGFLGSHLCNRLVDLGAEVLCFDNLSTGKIEYISKLLERPNFKFVKGDLLNLSEVKKIVKDVDVIYHLAAKVGVKHYVEDPIGVMTTNIYGTHNLLEAAVRRNVKRFLLASTSEVYGKNINVPLREDYERVLGPPSTDRWSYSTSKSVDEHLCNAYFRKYKLPTVILRYFNIYGPRQESSDYGGVVSIFIRRVLENQPPLVHGDGKQTRSFTYVSDAVEGTIQAALREEAVGETINLGNPRETTINELAELIIKLAGKAGKLRPKHIPYEEFYGPWYEDVPRRVPDISKAEKILGFKPKITLEEGLKKTIEWYKQYLTARD
jgi:UDP-glucose 4-epimerase